MERKKIIEEEIARLKHKIADKIDNIDESEFESICNKIYLLNDEFKLLDLEKVASNEEIDIYEENIDDLEKQYLITSHGEYKNIGFVRVTYKENAYDYRGNIGYFIKEDYRGNNYTLKALTLLKDVMTEKGLSKVVINAYPVNIPSVKIIEKFGGNLVNGVDFGLSYNMYEVDLTKNKGEKVKIK